MERQEKSATFPMGTQLPQFSLTSTDGTAVSQAYFSGAPAALVVFACNHCPYVIGSEKMLFDTIRSYQEKGLKAVIISSNDPVQYPEDSFEKMQQYAREKQFPCPYLFDETQEVAKKFDAACTPECYLFNGAGALVFHGSINNSPRFPDQVKANFLEAALEQAFSGKNPDPAFVHPIGCSIKWKI